MYLRFIIKGTNIKLDALAFLKFLSLTLLKKGNFMDTKRWL